MQTGGLFSPQEVGGGQTAITPINPVGDDSDVTKIRGLESVSDVIRSVGDWNKKDENKADADQVLVNFQQTIADLSAAKNQGKFTREQASQRALDYAQVFASENPHLRGDINKVMGELRTNYDFVKESVGEGSALDKQIEQDKAKAASIYLTGSQQKDPAKIEEAYSMYQSQEALTRQMEVDSKSIALTSAKLQQQITENTVANIPLTNEQLYMQVDIDRRKKNANDNYYQFAGNAVKAVETEIANIAEWMKAQPNPNDPAVLAEARNMLAAGKARSRSVLAQYQQLPYLETYLAESTGSAVNGMYDNMDKQLAGGATVEQFENYLKGQAAQTAWTMSNEHTTGKKFRESAGLRLLVGESPALANFTGIAVAEYLDAPQNQSGYGQDMPPIWSNRPEAKQANSGIMESLAYHSKAFNLDSTGHEAESKKRAIGESMYSYYQSALKSQETGTMEERRQGAYEFVNKFGSSPELERLIMTNPEVVNFDPNMRKSFKVMVNDVYGDPAFKSVNAMLEGELRKPQVVRGVVSQGKDVSDAVEMYWNNGVRFRPKAGLTPEQTMAASNAIKSVEKSLPVLSNIVKATALIDTSVDYEKELAGYSDKVFGLTPTAPKEQPAEPAAPAPTQPQQQNNPWDNTTKVPLKVGDDNVIIENKQTLIEMLQDPSFDDAEREMLLDMYDTNAQQKWRNDTGNKLKKATDGRNPYREDLK